MMSSARFRPLLLACTVALLAAVPHRDVTYALKRAVKVGDVSTYKFVGHLKGDEGPMDFEAKVEQKVDTVADDGGYQVEEKMTEIVVKGPEGAQSPQTSDDDPEIMRYNVDATGRISPADGQEENAPETLHGLLPLIWPGKTIRVGDEWEADHGEQKQLLLDPSHFKYRVEGIEKVADVDALHISFTCTQIDEDGSYESYGSYYVDPSTGAVLKMDAHIKESDGEADFSEDAW